MNKNVKVASFFRVRLQSLSQSELFRKYSISNNINLKGTASITHISISPKMDSVKLKQELSSSNGQITSYTKESNMGTHSRNAKNTYKQVSACLLSIGLTISAVGPAWATIDNTVTVTGSSPSGTDDVTTTDTVNVGVITAAPSLTVSHSADTAGPVSTGDVIIYTYTVTNTGNQTLTDVAANDLFDSGASASLSSLTLAGSPLTDNGTQGDSSDAGGDQIYDTLAPGDTVTWNANYTVTIQDVIAQVGGDASIDNTASALGTAPSGGAGAITDSSTQVSLAVDAVNASLSVAKSAGGATNVAVGDTITYTYVITNDGNVPISGISLADVHNGSGTAPAPNADGATLTDNGTQGDSTNTTLADNAWDTLAPNDVLTVSASYEVTQSDVDTLQ